MTDNSNQTRSLDSIFESKNAVCIDESDRLKLAKQVLFWIGCISVGVFVAFGMYPENKALASIFEIIKIGILPLITLIVSFYFPNSK